MKVLHITPTYFDDSSVIGGGERFPHCLAEAQSRYVPVTLLSFGPRDILRQYGGLTVKILKTRWRLRGRPANPLTRKMFEEINRADVVHCHQYHTLTTNLAILWCRLLKKNFCQRPGGLGREPAQVL